MKRFFILTISLILIVSLVHVNFEPSIMKAAASADSVVVNLTVESSISITSPTDVTMSPNMSATQDTSTGTATWNVKTNNTAGYDLDLKASTNSAMQSASDSFADYTETLSDSPETWSIDASAYEFGYSAYGNDVNTDIWGTTCNPSSAGVIMTGAKWLGFTTTSFDIASSTVVTTKAGTDTLVCFAAAQGSSVYAPSGAYSATITATATER